MKSWTTDARELILDEMARIPTTDTAALTKAAERYGRLGDYEAQERQTDGDRICDAGPRD